MRKTICIVLTLVVGFCSIFNFTNYTYAEEGQAENQEEKPKDIKEQREDIKKELDKKGEELEQVKTQISENLEQISKLDEKMENSQNEINELKVKTEELQKSIEKVEGKLKIVNEDYQKQKKILDANLIEIYESSDTKYLDVLLNSANISEFISNYFLITELIEHQTEMLEDIQKNKKEIDNSKKKLDEDNEQLNIIKQNKIKTTRILENTRVLRENLVTRLSNEEKGIQQQIDEYNARYNEINNEILELTIGNIGSDYIGGELAWPVPGYTRITSKFGMRYHPILHVNKLHTGVDIGAPMGANFVASNDGIVTKASYNRAYGNMVIIDHGGGVSTLYAHGSEILTEVGEIVKRGQPILKVGSTGYSTGAHAHFEVRINGVCTDPLPYITNGLVPKTQEQKEQEQKNNEGNNQDNNQDSKQ